MKMEHIKLRLFEDNLNTFILELKNPVSENTAKEMCKVVLFRR